VKALITGGAGFIGSNLASALAREGSTVLVADNLSRTGSAENLTALLDGSGPAGAIAFQHLDVRDPSACCDLVAREKPDCVVHLAAQVAVTSSLSDPLADFAINTQGTLNLLEAVRLEAPDAHLLFASTNKVYGSLSGLSSSRAQTRYELEDFPQGISESHPVRPETPYACSKMGADHYVRDYAASFGLRTTVFRLSCVYGPWQNGTADQGWVSWFVRAALTGEPVTIYGDGLQVRDLLHVDDLVTAVTAAIAADGAGGVYNVGGGRDFAVSVWAEFGELLEAATGRSIPVRTEDPRPGDQVVYVSDVSRARERLGWEPKIPPRDGVAQLCSWMATRLKVPVGVGGRRP